MSNEILTPRMRVSVLITKALHIAHVVPNLTARETEASAAELRQLLTDLYDETKAIVDYIDVQEGNLRELRNEGLRAEEQITALQQRIYAGTCAAEQLITTVSQVLDQATEAFNDARKVPPLLSGETPRPMGAPRDIATVPYPETTNQPRSAANRG